MSGELVEPYEWSSVATETMRLSSACPLLPQISAVPVEDALPAVRGGVLPVAGPVVSEEGVATEERGG